MPFIKDIPKSRPFNSIHKLYYYNRIIESTFRRDYPQENQSNPIHCCSFPLTPSFIGSILTSSVFFSTIVTMAATLSRASALAEPVATIKQRKVQAKSTIHDEQSLAANDNSSSDSDSDEDAMSTFTPPSFSVKDLLGGSRASHSYTFLIPFNGLEMKWESPLSKFHINGRSRTSLYRQDTNTKRHI